MFEIKLEHAALDKAIRDLSDLEKLHLPFVMSKTINNTAQQVRKAEVVEMALVFDRPTPFVLNSLYIYPSTKTRLQAEVFFKDKAQSFMRPQVYGGPRDFKRSERWLSNRFWVPGKAVRLNKYGNVSPGQITQVLSALKRMPDSAQNITARSRKRNKKPRDYFVLWNRKNGLRPGVWERTKRGIKPILMFISGPRYGKLLDFYGVGQRIATREFAMTFFRNLRDAIR